MVTFVKLWQQDIEVVLPGGGVSCLDIGGFLQTGLQSGQGFGQSLPDFRKSETTNSSKRLVLEQQTFRPPGRGSRAVFSEGCRPK